MAGNSDDSQPSFNLLDEPWLPVRRRDGRGEDVGLLALLRDAASIECLAEPSPPPFVALHRMLLVVTHRALQQGQGHWDGRDRARWFQQGLPTDLLVEYLERWRDRFWLFHPTHPFMQVAALAGPLPPKAPQRFGAPLAIEPAKPELLAPKGWAKLALECASGNNPVLFDHAVDDLPTPVAIAHVARQLLGYLQFAPGGPVKALCKAGNEVGGPLFNSAAFLPVGRSLAETLVLGLPPPTADDAPPDLPSWEREPLTLVRIFGAATLAAGPCDRYTRQTRSALLLQGPAGMVSRVLFAEGSAWQDDPMAPDPMTAFRPGTTNPWVRLSFLEGRAFWRDLGALLPDASGRLARPAPVLEAALRVLLASDADDRGLEYVVAGLAATPGQDKRLRGRIERHRLPQGVLGSNDAASAVRSELRRAEELFVDLRKIAERMTADTFPDPAHKDTCKRAGNVVRRGPLAAVFFSSAERALGPLLAAIGRGDLDHAHALWSAALLQATRKAWRAAVAALGDSPRAWRALAITEGRVLHLMQPLRAADQARAEAGLTTENLE